MSYGEGYRWTDDVKSPKALARTAKKNPTLAAAAGGAVAYAAGEKIEQKAPKKYKKKVREAQGAIGGAAAGGLAYQASGYGAKHANKKVNDPKLYRDPKTRRGYTKTEYKKKVEGHKEQYGIKGGKEPNLKGFLRNFPGDVPGGRVTRVLAHTHMGNRGKAVGLAAAAGGAALGVKHQKHKVEKSMDPHQADPFGIYEISKVSAKLKIIAGAKRGLFDAAGVTHPKLREKAYAGNGPVKSKLYNMARTKTRKEMEPRLIALREDPAVKRAAFRIVREEAGKKVQAAKPYAKGAAAGAVGVGAGVAIHHRKDKVAKNLTQEQIDRRKKVQAASSKTTATLGLAALGAQGASALVSRGKIKRLPHLKDGALTMRKVTKPKEEAENLKSKVTPLLATSAGVGAVSGFNFASYTKAEAKQHKNYS